MLVGVWLLQDRCGAWSVRQHHLLVGEMLEHALLGPPCAKAIADDERLGFVALLERVAHEAADLDVAPRLFLPPNSQPSCHALGLLIACVIKCY